MSTTYPPPPGYFNFNFKKLEKFLGGEYYFFRVDFSWEGIGTLPQNSHKPSQDQ